MKNQLLISSLASCVLAVGLVAGCGGGGGGPSSSSPEVSNPTAVPIGTTVPTPVATNIAGVCSPTSFTPNYSPSRLPGEFPNLLLRWSGFPVRVFIASTTSQRRQATIDGFDQWVAASGGRASYQIVSNRDSADLRVDFAAIEEQGTLGVTTNFYNDDNAVIVKSEMVLDYDKISRISDSNVLKEYVAAHEFGHALGLSLHSDQNADLMFPTVENREPVPTTRDVNTLRTAYCDSFPARSAAAIARAKNGPIKSVTHSLGRGFCIGHSH